MPEAIAGLAVAFRVIGVFAGLGVGAALILNGKGILPDWHWPAFNGLLVIDAKCGSHSRERKRGCKNNGPAYPRNNSSTSTQNRHDSPPAACHCLTTVGDTETRKSTASPEIVLFCGF